MIAIRFVSRPVVLGALFVALLAVRALLVQHQIGGEPPCPPPRCTALQVAGDPPPPPPHP